MYLILSFLTLSSLVEWAHTLKATRQYVRTVGRNCGNAIILAWHFRHWFPRKFNQTALLDNFSVVGPYNYRLMSCCFLKVTGNHWCTLYVGEHTSDYDVITYSNFNNKHFQLFIYFESFFMLFPEPGHWSPTNIWKVIGDTHYLWQSLVGRQTNKLQWFVP